jgi:diguanylate cyclase (GGDEF)-like protein/PAS domain S-box-containing protein
MLVERNDEILSAGLRRADGHLVAAVGDHAGLWDIGAGEKSTPTRIQVPIYTNATLKQKWGGVELSFAPTGKINIFGISINPLALMTVFVAVSGFMVFLLLIRKILTSIDPAAVMPARVRKALDTLNEGVLLIDIKGRILFANEVFANAAGVKELRIIGKRATDLDWKGDQTDLPWVKTLKSGVSAVGEKIELALAGKKDIQFIVNSTPVLDDKDKQKGVMVTFDDVTELEEKNNELRSMVNKLRASSEQINSQNEELRILATRDPLTNCLNRRSLFDHHEDKCLDAIKNNTELHCLMLDIDHFKHVNDTYGHAAGDEVLRTVSAAIQTTLRSNDSVFRYGGEEFCILLSGIDIKSATSLAERVRKTIETQVIDDSAEGHVIRVTASFGISSIKFGAENLSALIEAADAALYASKRSGRNRVTVWSAGITQAEQMADSQKPNIDEKADNQIVTALPAGEHQHIDKVTGLPNRAHFRSELARTIRHVRQQDQFSALLILDLDTFKRINNVFGYTVGDTVLQTVGERLHSALRASDMACRLGDCISEHEVYGLGGDEFGILLTGLESQDDALIVVQRLIELLSLPVTVNDQEVFLTCSIGVCQFPDGDTDADTLITSASVALQHAKRSGKNTYKFFHSDFVSVAKSDYEIEKALRYALDNNEFELYFQPQLDVQSLRIESMEALIRWNHPQRGIIMPGDFIAAAESSGQIVAIGQWVINTACQQIRSWLDAGLKLAVAVNLSPVQFLQDDLVEQINKAVSSARIDPKLLQLEITENMIMQNLDSALETMQTLARIGYKISIDDFGTGYSSLEYLKRFPVDNLKIDRSFIKSVNTDPGDAAIVRAAISMAHNMNLKVVAEGVETEEQLLFLRNLRCDMIQGYLLGMPLPAKEAIALIDDAQWQASAS